MLDFQFYVSVFSPLVQPWVECFQLHIDGWVSDQVGRSGFKEMLPITKLFSSIFNHQTIFWTGWLKIRFWFNSRVTLSHFYNSTLTDPTSDQVDQFVWGQGVLRSQDHHGIVCLPSIWYHNLKLFSPSNLMAQFEEFFIKLCGWWGVLRTDKFDFWRFRANIKQMKYLATFRWWLSKWAQAASPFSSPPSSSSSRWRVAGPRWRSFNGTLWQIIGSRNDSISPGIFNTF